jgi:hypothetical protein
MHKCSRYINILVSTALTVDKQLTQHVPQSARQRLGHRIAPRAHLSASTIRVRVAFSMANLVFPACRTHRLGAQWCLPWSGLTPNKRLLGRLIHRPGVHRARRRCIHQIPSTVDYLQRVHRTRRSPCLDALYSMRCTRRTKIRTASEQRTNARDRVNSDTAPRCSQHAHATTAVAM